MTGHFLKALTTYHCHQVLHHQFPFQCLPQSSLVRVQRMAAMFMTTCNLNAFIFIVLCVLADPNLKEQCVVIDGFSQLAVKAKKMHLLILAS